MTEFEFEAYPSLITPVDETQVRDNIAPELQSYIELALSTYESVKPLKQIRENLESAFSDLSIHFKKSEENYCAYSCKKTHIMCDKEWIVEFEVVIFSKKPIHVVEITRMNGERYAFNEILTNLADALKISYINNMTFNMPWCPPPLDLPELLDEEPIV